MRQADLEKTLAPRQRSKEDRRQEIMAAALSVFSEQGLELAKIDDVAARARVSKGTIYTYFESKYDLFAQVMRHWIAPHVDAIKKMSVDETIAPMDAIETVIDMSYNQVRDHNCREILRLLVAESNRFPEVHAYYANGVISQLVGSWKLVLKRGVDLGVFRPLDLDTLPYFMSSPMLSLCFRLLMGENLSESDLAHYKQAHKDFVRNALGAPAA